MNRVSPQGSFGAVARCVPEFAVLQHNLDGTGERLHGNLETSRQAGLAMCRLKCLPKFPRVVNESIAGVKGLRKIESCKAPGAPLRIGGLVVSVQTGRHVPDVPDAVKQQLVNHQPRHDLRLAGELQGSFLGEEFLLADEEREKLDLLPVKRIVNVTQPPVTLLDAV
jgi:hypothetical protein